jgi:hypothetical protein
MTEGGTIQCSFCGKTQDEVRKLIAGPKVYICDECVDLCNDIIFGEKPSIMIPLRMALRALWWKVTWRRPGGDTMCSMCERPATAFRQPTPARLNLICEGCLTLINNTRKIETETDRARRLAETATEHCFFCLRRGDEVGGLIAGRPPRFMCWDCVDAANRASPIASS